MDAWLVDKLAANSEETQKGFCTASTEEPIDNRHNKGFRAGEETNNKMEPLLFQELSATQQVLHQEVVFQII